MLLICLLALCTLRPGTVPSSPRVQHMADASLVERLAPAFDSLDHTSLDWRLGIYQGGATLVPLVWPRTVLVFAIEPDLAHLNQKFPKRPCPQAWTSTPAKAPKTLLTQFPVDTLILDHSRDYNAAAVFQSPGPPWHTWVDCCPIDCRPSILIQVWPESAVGSELGPLGVCARKFLQQRDYESHYSLVDSTEYGSHVRQVRLVIISFSLSTHSAAARRWSISPSDGLPPRPMSNCLRPYGAGKHVATPKEDCDPSRTPKSVQDPMPCRIGSWIETPQGFRRLYADELAKGLGVPTWRAKQVES